MRPIHLIPSTVAADVRAAVDGAVTLAHEARLNDAGVFAPIETTTGSGRARCRECGVRIEKDEPCVAFRLDLYQARFGRWGHETDAWIHHHSCPDDQEGDRQ